METLDGVDARGWSSQQIEARFDVTRARDRYGRAALPGEVGCTLAHLAAMRRFLDCTTGGGDQTLGLITEDDTAWTGGSVTALAHSAALDHEFTLLWPEESSPSFKEVHTIRKMPGGLELVRPLPFPRSTLAYLVSRRAAKTIVQRARRPFWIADDYQALREIGVDVRAIPQFPVARQDVTSTVDAGGGREASYFSLQPRLSLLRGRKSFLVRFRTVEERRMRRWHRHADAYARLPLPVRASALGRAASIVINDAATGPLPPQRLAARLG